MNKQEQFANPNSCLNRAFDDEPTFVLRAKDQVAPNLIREWVSRRIQLGENEQTDPKIREALELANQMSEWRRKAIADGRIRP